MNLSNYKILVVDDEPDVREIIKYNLEKEGFEVITGTNGEEAIELTKKEMPHLLILDIMMPEIDGIEVCKELRLDSKFKDILIVFLTARGEDYSQIAGLESGGDDYLTKPISPRVLISRIKAILRRGKVKNVSNVKEFGDLKIFKDEVILKIKDKEINLTKKEFEIIDLLSSTSGKVFSRREIFENIWGSDLIVGERTIDVHIRKIREKIGSHYIRTVKGMGYKFLYE